MASGSERAILRNVAGFIELGLSEPAEFSRFSCGEANPSLKHENGKAGILSNLQRIRHGIAGIYAASNWLEVK